MDYQLEIKQIVITHDAAFIVSSSVPLWQIGTSVPAEAPIFFIT